MSIVVREAGLDDAASVAALAHALVCEISPPGSKQPDLGRYGSAAADLLARQEGYWALLAEDSEGATLGLITLNECAAIYAGGLFGEIAELYVPPAQRSKGIAAALIEEAIAFARQRGWPRLEVGAPALPDWQRTVDFYRKQGFIDVGPRLKRLVEP